MATKSEPTATEAKPVTSTKEEKEQEQARNGLIHVCRVARTHYLALGKKQAPIVKAVLECLAVGVSRLEIGKIIAEELLQVEGSRDLGARYIDLARWHKREYRDTEVKHEGSVRVGDIEYDSPIDALSSGKHSFREVYETWRAVLRPQSVEASRPEPAETVAEGAAATLARAQVRYEVPTADGEGTKQVRLRMVDNPRNPEEQATPEAWASGMLALLEGAKVAKDVLGQRLYDQVVAALKKAIPNQTKKAA